MNKNVVAESVLAKLAEEGNKETNPEIIMADVFTVAWAALNLIHERCVSEKLTVEEATVQLAEQILGHASDMSTHASRGLEWRDYKVTCKERYWYNDDYHDEPQPGKNRASNKKSAAKKPATKKRSVKK